MARDRSKPHMKLASPGLVFAAVQNRLLAPAPVPPGLRDGTWIVKTRHFCTVRCAAPSQNDDSDPELFYDGAKRRATRK